MHTTVKLISMSIYFKWKTWLSSLLTQCVLCQTSQFKREQSVTIHFNFFFQNNVMVMTPNICIFTGEIRSWFVNIPEISQSENSRLRFVMTRANFCVLDSSYNIYHDYKFRMVKCEVSFDIETDMVELKVYTDDGVYQTSKAYKLFLLFFSKLVAKKQTFLSKIYITQVFHISCSPSCIFFLSFIRFCI